MQFQVHVFFLTNKYNIYNQLLNLHLNPPTSMTRLEPGKASPNTPKLEMIYLHKRS